jgi:hypothetical protein
MCLMKLAKLDTKPFEDCALCTDLVVEHLSGVDCLEWGQGEREEDAVEENHYVAGACSDVDVGFGGEDADRNIGKSSKGKCPRGRAASDTAEEGEDGIKGVEQEFLVGAGDTDILQDVGM